MKGRLLNVLTIASLLLCLTSLAFWVRSYFVWDRFYLIGEVRLGTLHSLTGRIRLAEFGTRADGPSVAWQRDPDPSPLGWRAVRPLFQFAYASGVNPPTRLVDFPHWVVTATGAVMPVVRYRRRRRQPAPGLCTHCGYDLTGNASGACPECGTPRREEKRS